METNGKAVSKMNGTRRVNDSCNKSLESREEESEAFAGFGLKE